MRDVMTADETILIRVQRVEKDIDKLQAQLNLYVPMAVNDLKMNSVLEATNRISVELQDVKSRLAEQQENTSKIQINVLKATVGTFVSVVIAIFVGYITHFFH